MSLQWKRCYWTNSGVLCLIGEHCILSSHKWFFPSLPALFVSAAVEGAFKHGCYTFMCYCHLKTLLSASLTTFYLSLLRVGLWNAGSECCIDGTEIFCATYCLNITLTMYIGLLRKWTTWRVKTLGKRTSPHRRRWEVAPATTSSQGKTICRGRCCAVRSLYCSPSELCTLWFACTPPCKALCFQRDHSKSTVSSPPSTHFSKHEGKKFAELVSA